MTPWLFLTFRLICAGTLLLAPAGTLPPALPAPQATLDWNLELDPPEEELSPAQEQAMWDEIRHNLASLQAQGILADPNAAQAVSYQFPLRLAPGLPDYAGFRVSAFSDHNPAAGQVLDYMGGSRTYDGHRATDYALWPFGWNKLDGGEMQVIAAAAGTIAYYANVDSTDHHCAATTDPWNYIGVVHADGRLTIYGHMRYNSLTSKHIGQSVAQGEYLGTAASSGNSSGPHLHFEVRYGSYSNAEWIDPYAGPSSQAQSLWENQRPYVDSAINKLSTHSAPPSSPDPCLAGTPNMQDSFIISANPVNIYFYAYYRDYQGPLVTQFQIFRPDGSLYQAWQDVPDVATLFPAAYRAKAFAFLSSDPAGTWRFTAAYNGQSYETFFNVNAPTAVTVSQPNGGQSWDRSHLHAIHWSDNLGGPVNLALYQNGSYLTTLAYNTASDGEFLWLPGAGLAPGAGYTIRVSSVLKPTVFDQSDAPFALLAVSNLKDSYLPLIQR